LRRTAAYILSLRPDPTLSGRSGFSKPASQPILDKLAGTINKLTFQLEPDQMTAEEREEMNKTVAKARD
jgi:hypothetical protein